ncbi:MAG: hypothetical protein HY897_16090 [Deltaproteobacteria bacterium]|nr:hypothetical protein [Deltaproteobacteria bacterium]
MVRALPKLVITTALVLMAHFLPPAPAAHAAELPGIMVLNIKPEEDAGPGIAKILTELVLQELHDLKKFRVVGEKDVDQMLNTEQRKQLAGCTDTSCLIEIAGAMGTKYTLDGTVGVVGSSNVLSLSLIDVTKAAVVSKKTTVVKGEREHLLESVHKLVGELMGPVSEYGAAGVGAAEATPNRGGRTERNPPVRSGPIAPPPAGTRPAARMDENSAARAEVTSPMNPYKLWGHVGVWTGAALVATGGIFAILTKGAGDAYKTGKDPLGSKDDFETYKATAIGTTVAGAVLAGAGVTLWLLDPGSNPPRATLAPQIAEGSVGLAVTGGW